MKRRGHIHQRHALYHLASADEKRRMVLARWRALELVRCPDCSVGVQAGQLAAHAERCTGSVAERNADVLRGRR